MLPPTSFFGISLKFSQGSGNSSSCVSLRSFITLCGGFGEKGPQGRGWLTGGEKTYRSSDLGGSRFSLATKGRVRTKGIHVSPKDPLVCCLLVLLQNAAEQTCYLQLGAESYSISFRKCSESSALWSVAFTDHNLG